MKKRLFDLALVISSSPFWVPAIGALALAVWALDGRPVFFLQSRVGRERRPFSIWKLRTMTTEADEKLRRPTRLGRWLRARGLDELPQVLNVLAGSMSLVGPRPLSISDAERLVQSHPPFAERFRVAPGITGAAQVGGVRGAALTAQVDLQYTRRCSIALDAALLMRTVWINVVGKSKGTRPWQSLLGDGTGTHG